MRNKNKPDFVKLLNYNLSYNPIFESLYKTTSKVLDEQIGEPLSRLSRIRSSQHIKRGDYLDVETSRGIERGRVADVKIIQEDDGSHYAKITLGLGNGNAIVAYKEVLQDRKTLINQAAFAGVDYYSDYISDAEYARLVDYAGSYWKHQNSGERDFIDFIGFIKGMRLSLIQLWTRDQGDYATNPDEGFNFYEYLIPEEDVVDPFRFEGNASAGTEYLTSHVDMEYDVLASPNIGFNDLINLFYYFAPIELVLNRIVGSIEIEVETHAVLVPQIDGNILSRYKWEPHTIIEAGYTEPIPQIDINLGTYIFLDSYFEEIDPDYDPYEHNWVLSARSIYRSIEFTSNSIYKSNTDLGRLSKYEAKSSFITIPATEFAISTYYGNSSLFADRIQSIYRDINFEGNSLLITTRKSLINRIMHSNGYSNLDISYTVKKKGVSTYNGVSSFTTIYSGAFDLEAFDVGYK